MNINNILTGEKSRSLSWWSRKNGISPAFARDVSKCINNPKETPFIVHDLMLDFRKLVFDNIGQSAL